jgi:cytochrome c oxidase subunit 3
MTARTSKAADGLLNLHQPRPHFDDLSQQHDAAELGMWVFLATEVLLFGGLFCGYTIYRVLYPEAFAFASEHLYRWIGGTNTAVLLISSLTMALAVRAAKLLDRRGTLLFLSVTTLLGLTFLIVKAIEYTLDWRDRIVPGPYFDAHDAPDPGHAELFMVFYFIMTGLHTLHMIAGVLIMSTLTVRAAVTHRQAALATTVEISGLYWHFVDLVWIFLLPLLYLIK